MKPEQFLKRAELYLAALEEAKDKIVKVGLPAGKVGGKIYSEGITVITVGAWHEYGFGNNPVRSFLRVPFAQKKNELFAYINKQFQLVLDGKKDAEGALNFVGIFATNISKEAFTTSAGGTWPANAPYTIAKKGSSMPMIDTGTLRNSITWLVTKE